jgi:phosphoglycerate dehydrogenase-like enzyme
MVRPRVVITDCDHGTVEPELAILRDHAEVSLHQCRDEAGLIGLCRDADGVITQYGAFTRAVIDALTRCRVIARYGVGVDTIDLEAASARGIVVANVPDYGTDEVSSHAAALILALHRRIARCGAGCGTSGRGPRSRGCAASRSASWASAGSDAWWPRSSARSGFAVWPRTPT